MKKYEKEVQQAFLNNEEAVIKRLKQVYGQSLKDIEKKTQALQDEINRLGTLAKLSVDADEKEKLLSMQQSKIYQRQYQQALKTQVSGILDNLHAEEFKTISDYLVKCYDEGFMGAMYSLQQQGIPMCFPIDQTAMVRAVQLDSKISKGLYSRLGEDIALLKKKITAQVSRGISTGMSFQQVAQQLAAYTNIGYNNAVRIARTEGHRIQIQSADNACREAKAKGADIVRQWDATLDSRTRESHTFVDGEIRELDKPFSNGLMFPGDPSGGAAEVVNCRCALLQRARWALDEDELQTLKDRAEYFGLDKAENFDDFKKTYLKSAEQSAKMESENISVECQRLLDWLKGNGVDFNPVGMHSKPLTDSEIINALAGGDCTSGSCASVGLAYCGQKGGMDVLDFRGGKSLDFFSTKPNLFQITKFPGVKSFTETARSSVTAGNKLLKNVEVGKEYYLVCGRHASIVRKTSDGVLQYLELQSARNSGWTNFDGNPRYTLKTRFGENKGYDCLEFMIDVDSIKDSDDLKKLLGYINTAEDKQRKGKYGTIK